MDVVEYRYYRGLVETFDPASLKKSGERTPPVEPGDFARRVAFVILNGGMNSVVAKGIWARMEVALTTSGLVGDTFCHPGKSVAIDDVMVRRDELFAAFREAWGKGAADVIEFCGALPYVGPTTKFHVAKLLGVDCAKPDVWLERVAAKSGEGVQALCTRLSLYQTGTFKRPILDYVANCEIKELLRVGREQAMTAESYAEFVGLTPEAIALIERARQSPLESKSAILVRVLTPPQTSAQDVASNDPDAVWFDFGEGIRIREDEPLFLFLSRSNRYANKPDAKAVIRKDGFYLDGDLVGPSDKRQFTPAMKMVQIRKNHIDADGKPTSTGAMRRWCVLRDGEIVTLEDIKEPELARKRNALSPAERKRQVDELARLIGPADAA